MNVLLIVQSSPVENIVALPVRQPAIKAESRFNVIEFQNKSGSKSYRVDGYKRDGSRVRENFAQEPAARCRQNGLETEYLQGHAETAIQATKLTLDQIRLCEASIVQLGDDWQRILDAVTYWQQHGKQRAVAESPRLDDAVDQYIKWLDTSPFRDATKSHWTIRIKVFKGGVRNIRIADATPEFVEGFLFSLVKREKNPLCPSGVDTYRRAISRFFSWCIEKKWITTNPARKLTRTRKAETIPPAVLAVKRCKSLLRAAEPEGLAPYVAVCLFGGLRPFEASRLTWEAVNLTDREIRLEANQTKTRKARVVSICDTLAAWLKAHKGKPFFPVNWRKKFDAVKKAAKITEWPADVMRHTAISHYFRRTGSYGRTAEQFGNSEAIIKSNYQARVASEETKKFYALRPAKGCKK